MTHDYRPSPVILDLMNIYRRIMNTAIDAALKNNLTSEGSISAAVYPIVKDLKIPSYYIPTAITRAIAMVKSYRKSLRKEERRRKGIEQYNQKHPDGKRTLKKREISMPHVEKSMLGTHYGFFIQNGSLMIPNSP